MPHPQPDRDHTALLTHDVAVVGGGPAGLSAAVALARSLRRVVLVDAGEPRNAPATGAHNVLGREGVAPRDLLAAGRREAEQYGAEVRHDRVVAARRVGTGFALELAGGDVLRVRRLLLATGLADELPDVPGVRECWGRTVLHCPYCHGYEVRGQRLVVLATGPMAEHQALLFRQLSDDVTLVVDGMPDPGPEVWEQLGAVGVRVVPGPVARLRIDGRDVRAVVLADGGEVPADAVVVAPRFVARTDLYEQLGGTATEHPLGAVIETDARGATALPGVWAAGNARDLTAMVSLASGAGLMTGAALNAELAAEEAREAVERHRLLATG